MTLFYYDSFFQEHRTGNHPERGERLASAVRHLQWMGIDAACCRPTWEPISFQRLTRIHSPNYVEALTKFCDVGGGWIEADTFVCPKSFDVAIRAAGAVCDAVQRIITGEDRQAFCMVRPPGHHALALNAMGFCLFNNVAIGARLACDEFELDRVLIVDWDVHHGNGTQQAFWEDGRVGFLSIHRSPFYPGTGAADETGSRDGLGTTMNLPVQFGTPRSEYLKLFAASLEKLADKLRPQLVIISAGFDSHRADPIGSLELETEDFIELTRLVHDVASQHARGRVLSVLEGGYNPEALSDCIDVHLSEFLARDPR